MGSGVEEVHTSMLGYLESLVDSEVKKNRAKCLGILGNLCIGSGVDVSTLLTLYDPSLGVNFLPLYSRNRLQRCILC